jgi:hypothetical protein
MYKIVENSVELAMFNFIWMTAWREKGFQFEFSEQVLERYLVITDDGEFAGSVEIKPYTGTGELDNVAPFREHPLIQADPTLAAEIDKVALLPEYRRRYTSDLLSAGIYSAWTRGIHYMLALLEPVFWRALRITYHVPMETIGEKTFYKGGQVIPTLIKVREIYDHPADYPWLNLNPQAIHPPGHLQHR